MNNKEQKSAFSRTQNVSRNVIWAVINQLITIMLSLISRKIFLNILGAEFLGVNSLFADVMSLFSFADLGFGTAIVFSLYKPIADGNQERIKSLLKNYRTIYRYVIGVLVVIGIAFVPFLPHLNTTIPLNQLRLYYFLYQTSCIIGYVCAYRETYVSACQQQRTITKFGILFSVIQILSQIAVVELTANYAAYVVTALVMAVIRKITVNLYIVKKFPETRVRDANALSKEDKIDIFKSAKAVLIHRLGNLAINQTDSLIVSTFINMTEWGLMSNYLVLKTAVSRLLDNIYSAVLPSMGNLVAKENEEKQIRIFNTYDYLNFWLYLFCYIALGTLSSRFISIYFGEQYVLNEVTVFIFFTAFYIDGLRTPVSSMREANGSFRTDQWYTILAAIVNLVVSIALVQKIGLNGVYIGTCCAMIVLHITRSIMLFRNWKDYNVLKYLARLFKYIISGIIIYHLTLYIQKVVCWSIENTVVKFVVCGTLALIVPNVIVIIFFRKNQSFNEAITLVKGKIRRRTREFGE